MKTKLYSLTLAGLMSASCFGQQMDWESYDPPSTLVVPESPITKAKFPFIDVHSHQYRMGPSDLDDRIVEMDAMNMGIMVNLSGRGGSQLKAMASNVQKHHPSRFALFTNIDFNNVDETNWATRTISRLEEDVQRNTLTRTSSPPI